MMFYLRHSEQYRRWDSEAMTHYWQAGLAKHPPAAHTMEEVMSFLQSVEEESWQGKAVTVEQVTPARRVND